LGLEKALTDLKKEHPYFCEIITRARDMGAARKAAAEYITRLEAPLHSAGNYLPGVDAAIARETINVLSDVFSERGEAISGASALMVIKRLLAGGDYNGASPALVQDMRHLLRGAQGAAGAGKEERPSYIESGSKASRSREAYLSRVAENAMKGIERHKDAMDAGIRDKVGEFMQKLRQDKKQDEKQGVEDSWTWKDRLELAMDDIEELSRVAGLGHEEQVGLKEARNAGFPVTILPRQAALMVSGKGGDRLKLCCLPTKSEIESYSGKNENTPGIKRTGPGVMTLRLFRRIPFWQERCGPYIREQKSLPARLDKVLRKLESKRNVFEVRIKGGEPFLLDDPDILSLVSKLAGIGWVERIALNTRLLATLPSRFTPALCSGLARAAGSKRLSISARFLCTLEVGKDTMEAASRLKLAGISLNAEVPFESTNTSRFAPAALRRVLARCGFSSCNFKLPGLDSSKWRRVPVARALMENEEEARLIPKNERLGFVSLVTSEGDRRTLNRRRNRQVVGLLPNGSRVYEMLPRDRELAAARTKRYFDLPILDYLTRLSQIVGEDPKDYRTIWYYF